MEQHPVSAENRPMDGASMSGIQIIEDVSLPPVVINSNDNVGGDDGTGYEVRMNHTEPEPPYWYDLENGM